MMSLLRGLTYLLPVHPLRVPTSFQPEGSEPALNNRRFCIQPCLQTSCRHKHEGIPQGIPGGRLPTTAIRGPARDFGSDPYPNPERYWRWSYLKATGLFSPNAKRKAAALFLAKQKAQTLALFQEFKARTSGCYTFQLILSLIS